MLDIAILYVLLQIHFILFCIQCADDELNCHHDKNATIYCLVTKAYGSVVVTNLVGSIANTFLS